ncbi:helix-turn-helix domain-containing protein [Leucobacter albus]|uniref:Helix-turn-helix domain-containing protein n=1 Tax=Leucobacter albus TaxID=272210 RepID=A0ABW3TJY3_9MICO
MTHLQRLRAERMAYLLRTTELTVAATGRTVGWSDPSYASRRFSAHWGVSPSDYRRRAPATPAAAIH